MTVTHRDRPAAGRSREWTVLLGLLGGGVLSAVAARQATARALARERRRVAADVHDLVMQDLSLAVANARTLAAEVAGSARASVVVSAGERALAGARVVVGDLAQKREPLVATLSMHAYSTRERGEAEPIVRAIEASAQAAARSARLVFDADGVPGSVQPDGATREALVHIAREAVTNATKHAAEGNAIEVTLQYDGSWRLTVRDEGGGFDAESANNGFGLSSMRAHAQALGGVLHVNSTEDEGTTLEVVLP